MSNIDKQALRGLSVESPFYLAECCNCGEIMPSSKLRESRNYPDDDGECHCPHCNADDCDIADSGAVGSEGVTAWNYQQKRIEALLDELEAKDKRIAELETSHSNLREAMAGIHNTITGGGAYTPLAAILSASKRAYEESAAAAGKGEAS
ncbi:ead/Ea22-like family protein [Enterobacter asburiae]